MALEAEPIELVESGKIARNPVTLGTSWQPSAWCRPRSLWAQLPHLKRDQGCVCVCMRIMACVCVRIKAYVCEDNGMCVYTDCMCVYRRVMECAYI